MASSARARPNHRKSRYPFIRSLPTIFWRGENGAPPRRQMTGFLPIGVAGDGNHTGNKRSCAKMLDRSPRGLESRKVSAGHTFQTLLAGKGEGVKTGQSLMRHSNSNN